ncbi:uncharacterized protein tmem79a [Xenentodon cancila]
MSDQDDLVMISGEEVAFSSAGPTAEPQVPGGKKPQNGISPEVREEVTDEDEEEEEEHEEHEEMISSAHLEPSTLPWQGDRDQRILLDQDQDKGLSGLEEMETGISRGSQDLSEEGSQEESEITNKTKWRESMPEGERWRHNEIEVQRDNDANDEKEKEKEEEEEDDDNGEWISEKSALSFTPHVKVVCPSAKELPEEDRNYKEKEVERELQMEPNAAFQFYPEWEVQDDKYYLCEHLCSEKVRLILATMAAALLFPLLVWGGYAWLPFESPLLQSASLRVMYTLRCSFFAMIPILLGVVVQGVARLRYSSLKPLHQGNLVNKEVVVHWHYVNDSLALFLIYFLQLGVMATYISQDLVKLVPLLTIVFVFGRLIYWLCLSLGSTLRGFGFGFSFFPVLVMLGTNLYFMCSSVGQGSVFDVAPPTTAPPPRMRWWF